MRHLEHDVIAFLVDLRDALVLSIGKLVNLDPLIVLSFDIYYHIVLENEWHTQKERAADLLNALGLASREKNKVIVEYKCTFDVEVLDIGISLNKPVPFLR